MRDNLKSARHNLVDSSILVVLELAEQLVILGKRWDISHPISQSNPLSLMKKTNKTDKGKVWISGMRFRP